MTQEKTERGIPPGSEGGGKRYNPKGRKRDPFPTIALDDEVMLKLVMPDNLVRGLMGEKNIAVLWGSPSAGKSFWGIDLGMSIARGILFGLRKTLKGSVLYVAREGQRTFPNRVTSYFEHHFLSSKERQAARADTPFRLIFAPVNLGPANKTADVDRIIDTADWMVEHFKQPMRLVIFDTMRAVTPGMSENDSDEIEAFVDKCKRIAEATNAAILIIHHSGKKAALGARGSNALIAAADVEIEIECDETTKKRAWSNNKERDIEGEQHFAFTLEKILLGTVDDQDGEPVDITSCWVKHGDRLDAKLKDNGKASGKPQRDLYQWEMARDALFNTLANFPVEQPRTKQYPPLEITCTTIERFKHELLATGIISVDIEPTATEKDKEKAQARVRAEFSRIRVTLRKKNLYRERDKLCWYPGKTGPAAGQTEADG